MRLLETADDQEQAKVIIQKQTLAKIERLLRVNGFKEDSMPIELHHFLVGAFSYLMAAPVSKMGYPEVSKFLTSNKTGIKAFVRAVSSKLATASDVDKDFVQELDKISGGLPIVSQKDGHFWIEYILEMDKDATLNDLHEMVDRLKTGLGNRVKDIFGTQVSGVPAIAILANKVKSV